MRYLAYPTYKSSGIEWLGELPEHWKTKAIKWESPVLRGASPRPIDDPKFFDEEGEYAWVRISDVTTAGMYLSETEQRLSTLGSSLSVRLQPGALFLSIAATVGKPAITKIKCCIHDGFVYFPRFKGDPRFLFYVFASGEPYKGLGKLGTQLNLNTDTVGSIIVGFPGVSDQRTIADFLDAESAKLDTLVAKKRELIEKLKEKRSALISRTVTRGLPPEAARAAGLNPNPKLKPSGIEWLGEIPEHWERKPAKATCERIVDCKNRTPVYDVDGEYLVVRTTDVKGGKLDFTRCLRTDKESFCEWTRRGAPETCDVLFTREAPAGEAAIYDGSQKICLGQRMMYFRANSDVLVSRFLLYSIYGSLVQSYIIGTSGGSTVTHLRLNQVYNLPLLIPPIDEQRAIADYLDRETNKIDRMVAKVEEAIERLQEYRTALITAAVTGKIDVRNVRHSGESRNPGVGEGDGYRPSPV